MPVLEGAEQSIPLHSLSAASAGQRSLLMAKAGSVRGVEWLAGSRPVEGCAVLHGSSVLLAVKSQLSAAMSLIELDGVARRVILCTPDLKPENLAVIAQTAGANAAIVDYDAPASLRDVIAAQSSKFVGENNTRYLTEWVLLTSGTNGTPKLVQHDLTSLAGPVSGMPVEGDQAVWGTFYDIRRYGGLQIFLRAVLGGASLVLSDPDESTADYLARAGACGVTHISGTPSHWRKVLMSPPVAAFAPRYIRLSGEIADQAILDQLHQRFPDTSIAHAYAATEAGVVFVVTDGEAGFPASVIGGSIDGAQIKITDGTLRIRSSRTASRYLGEDAPTLRDADGFVDTGDFVELAGGRYLFAGRRGGVINVGGAKVYPEEVEAIINRHPAVQMALVRSRKNPLTGAVVVADIVLQPDAGQSAAYQDGIKQELFAACRSALSSYKVPATIRIVPNIDVNSSGKLRRHDA